MEGKRHLCRATRYLGADELFCIYSLFCFDYLLSVSNDADSFKCFGILNVISDNYFSYTINIIKFKIYFLFIKIILDMNDNLSVTCESGDTQISDRGFRDVANVFEESGFDVKVSGFIEKGDKQLESEQANETRMVTKTRWTVEPFHSQFKK